MQALEMRCYRNILGISSYLDRITNYQVRETIQHHIGPHEDLLTKVKKRKLRWYGHITRSSGLSKTILQGTVEGGRRRGRQKKRRTHNVEQWTGKHFAETQTLSTQPPQMEQTGAQLVKTAPQRLIFSSSVWNTLPQDLCHSSSLASFKGGLQTIAKQSWRTTVIVSQTYCVNQDHQSDLTPLGVLDLQGTQKTLLGMCPFHIKAVSPRL
ncbi:hypothetical protein ACOMHN_036597 [Nucella lapillus]